MYILLPPLSSRAANRHTTAGIAPIVDKKPSDSRTIVKYNFTTDDFLKENYRNPWNYMRKVREVEVVEVVVVKTTDG